MFVSRFPSIFERGMASVIRTVAARRLAVAVNSIRTMSNEGSIRDAGGALSEKEKAEENLYFRKLQQEQLKALKSHHDEEIKSHEDEIKRLQNKIKEHKDKIDKLDKH